MFRENITFVVGAGASYEFGFPVGTGLADSIKKSSLLKIDDYHTRSIAGDQFFADTVARIWPTPEERVPVRGALAAIHDGIHTSISIDAFIHRNSGDPHIPQLGKMLIALEILKAERASTMNEKSFEAMDPATRVHPDHTWIGQFVRILFDGVTRAEDVGKGVRIICFNYDRCIEYYLRDAIVAAFRVPMHVAHDIVKGMNIIHPYGWLGELAQNKSSADDKKISFGRELDDYVHLEKIAENIRTYTEGFKDPNDIKAIHAAVEESNVLVFLGFGFNNQNLDLLRVLHRQELEPRRIYATGYGISSEVDDTMKRRIRNLFSDIGDEQLNKKWNDSIYVGYGVTCGKLFDMHNMNLSKFTQNIVSVYNDVPRIELVSARKR